MTVLYTAVGGALGATARYLMSVYLTLLVGDAFPYGTFLVNILGSMALGFLYSRGITSVLDPNLRTLLTVGFLGSFTTFSTFSNEVLIFLREGNLPLAIGYSLLSLVLGVVAAGLGSLLAGFF